MPSIANVSSRSITVTGKPNNYMKRFVNPSFMGYGTAQGWYSQVNNTMFAQTGFDATDDFLVVGDARAYNVAQTYDYSGQVVIYSVSTGNILQILTNPTHNAAN